MGAASGRAFFLYVYRNKRQQSHQGNRRTGRVIRPCPQSRDQMQGPVEAVVNSCVVDLHEVPVVVRQAVFRRMVADLVQRGLVGRPGGDVGIVAHGERDAAPPSRQVARSPLSFCTKRLRIQFVVGLSVRSIFETLNVSCVFQRRREKSTSTVFWLTSDASSRQWSPPSSRTARSRGGGGAIGQVEHDNHACRSGSGACPPRC